MIRMYDDAVKNLSSLFYKTGGSEWLLQGRSFFMSEINFYKLKEY